MVWKSRLTSLLRLTTRQRCLFVCNTFLGGCAWGCIMCSFVANQCDSCRTIQVFEWLHSRTPESGICIGMCTDGVAAMTEWLSRFTIQVKELASECESMHCVILREMLARWKMSPERNNILHDVIKIVSHIKISALYSCLFSQLCEETDVEHTHLLYTKVG